MADPIQVANPASQIEGATLLIAGADQIVTGEHSYNRAPLAPVVVEAGSAKVDNLDADLLDGEEGSAYHNASNLDAGTVPGARFPATLPAASAENLTTIPADQLTGTVPDGSFPATLPAVSGENLTDLDATALVGLVPDASMPDPLPAVSGENLTDLDAAELTGTVPDGSFPATLPAVSGRLVTMPSCAITRTAAQTIPDATETDVLFTAEDHDNATMHDTGSVQDRIVIPYDGVYLICAHVIWDANASGARRIDVTLNDPAPAALAAKLQSIAMLPSAAESNVLAQTVSVVRRLTAGDIVRINVSQTSGGNLDILSTTTYGPRCCWASCTMLSA